MSYRTTPLDWALLIALVVIWGSSFVMTKVAVATLSADWVSALRLAIGAVMLLAIAAATRQLPAWNWPTWRKYLVLGIIGNALPFFLISWGTNLIPSGVAGLLMGTIPLFILVLAHFALPGEQLNRYRIAGFALGFSGLMLILDPRQLGKMSLSGDALWGEGAVLASCLCYAVHAVAAKRMGFDKPFAQSSGVLLAGAAVAVPWAMLHHPQELASAPPLALWAAFGLGLLPTGLATVLSYKLIERTSPTFTAQSNYLVPVFALGLGTLALHEPLPLTILAALALILAGIFVSRRQPREMVTP